MQFKSWRSYEVFSNAITNESRYIFDDETTLFLETLLYQSEDRVRVWKKGSVLWRAQLGHEWREEYEGDELIGEFPAAYSPKRMKPQEYFASEGRANPKGIPYLYLATDRDTALSEVRPWIGSVISAGQFVTSRKLRLIDFSVEHGSRKHFHFTEPNEKDRAKIVWSHIDNAFSTPVTESDLKAAYAPTQVIAEYIKASGYDGIVYKSSLADGYNLALFDLESARLANCVTHEATSLAFNFEQTDNMYYIEQNQRKK